MGATEATLQSSRKCEREDVEPRLKASIVLPPIVLPPLHPCDFQSHNRGRTIELKNVRERGY